MLFKTNALVALLSSLTVSVDGFTTRSPSFVNSFPTQQHNDGSLKLSSLSMIDPSAFHDLSIQAAFSTSQLLSDAAVVADTVNAAVAGADSVAAAAAVAGADSAAAVADATNNNGGLGFLTVPIEAVLEGIHKGIAGVGVSNAWGLSIIALTMLIKVVTYPLTKTQLESSVKMQAVQPVVKEIQAKYASNPEVMNQKIAAVYKENEVNPLAGCFPAIIQIPVFVGLYRAVLNLASENALDEPFLWLPSLEGPTYGAALGKGNDWLTKGLVDGVPSLGWANTAAFLTIPIILVASQAVSIELNKKGQTAEQMAQTDNIVFKLLPLFLGWVSVGVPSALGIYWIANNVITTALTLQIRSAVDANPPTVKTVGGGGGEATMSEAQTNAFNPAPMREKPSGFASMSGGDSEGVSPITTTAIDAEVVESDEGQESNEVLSVPNPSKKKRGKKRKKKN